MVDIRTIQASKARLYEIIFGSVLSAGAKITGLYYLDSKDNTSSAFNISVGSVGYSKTGITLKGDDKVRPIQLVKISLVNTFGGTPTKDVTSVNVWDFKHAIKIVSNTVDQTISVGGVYDINNELMRRLSAKFMKSTTISDATGKATQVDVNNDVIYFMLVLNEETTNADDFVIYKYLPGTIISIGNEIPEQGFVPFTLEIAIQGELNPQILNIQKKDL